MITREWDTEINLNDETISILCEFDKSGMLEGVYKYDLEETFYLEDGKNIINSLPRSTIEKIEEDREFYE